jgi:hypothetical protein
VAGTNPYLSMNDVAKTCAGQYVLWVKHGQTIYLTDPRKPGTLLAWEAWYAHFAASGGQTWAVYEDTADNPFSSASPAPPCASNGAGPVSQAEWTAASAAQEGAFQIYTGKPVIFNGLASGYNKQLPAQIALLDGPVAGGEAEVCATKTTVQWLNELTVQIHAVLKHKYFVCHNEDASDGSTASAIAWRQWQFASLVIDYDLNYSVYESYFAVGPSNLRVQPESWVVPTQPVKPTINYTTDLLKATGVYGRTYKACYVMGVLVGACGVLVNANPTTVAYPWSKLRYQHTLLLSGSGVYDGATASANGPAPATSIPAYSGEIVFP